MKKTEIEKDESSGLMDIKKDQEVLLIKGYDPDGKGIEKYIGF